MKKEYDPIYPLAYPKLPMPVGYQVLTVRSGNEPGEYILIDVNSDEGTVCIQQHIVSLDGSEKVDPETKRKRKWVPASSIRPGLVLPLKTLIIQ